MLAIKRAFSKIHYSLTRAYGTNSKLINVTHEDNTGITTISLSRPPVNSLNTELLKALNISLLEAQKQNCRGVILTSSLPTIFSAGLDIMELYGRNENQLTEFWHTLQEMWLTLYGLEIPIVAAINGASPAGGCLLALSCEYRVFVDGNHTIGFNETKLGIVAPEWFKQVYIQTIGYRKAEMALLKGTLFNPTEALGIGLVDELASTKENAMKRSQDYIKGFKYIPSVARQKTKMRLRNHNLLWLKVNRGMDLTEFLTFVQSEEVQANLKLYMESLKRK